MDVLALSPRRWAAFLCEGTSRGGGHWLLAGRKSDGAIVTVRLPYADRKGARIRYNVPSAFKAALQAEGWSE